MKCWTKELPKNNHKIHLPTASLVDHSLFCAAPLLAFIWNSWNHFKKSKVNYILCQVAKQHERTDKNLQRSCVIQDKIRLTSDVWSQETLQNSNLSLLSPQGTLTNNLPALNLYFPAKNNNLANLQHSSSLFFKLCSGCD